MAQVVVGEDEETGLQVTVDLFQILEQKQKNHKASGAAVVQPVEQQDLTLSCSKSCRRKVATVAVMPMKRLITIRNT